MYCFLGDFFKVCLYNICFLIFYGVLVFYLFFCKIKLSLDSITIFYEETNVIYL